MHDESSPAAYPCVRYADAEGAVAFLCKAFGFERLVVTPGGKEGSVARAELQCGNAVVLVTPLEGEPHTGTKPGSGQALVYLAVPEIDAHLARATAGGATIVAPLRDRDGVGREYTARDPEGNLWVFGTYRPVPRRSPAAEMSAAADRVLDIASAHVGTTVLYLAMALGIPDLLASGPRPVAELAKATGVDEHSLYRVLRALAGLGVFRETERQTFASTPAAELLRSTPGSLRPLTFWLSDPFHFRVYSEAMHSVRTGEPAVERVVGVPLFEHLARDQNLSKIFNDAMTSVSDPIHEAVLAGYDFGSGVVVDVGGGHGSLLSAILRKNPSLRGILFDIDHVAAGARATMAAAGVTDRCQIATGSFFEGVPAGGDTYIMKHIIHDWDDERCVRILKHVRTALEGKPNGRVLILDAILAPGNEPDLFKLMDFEMLVVPGGAERRKDEFESLLTRSGFELTRVVSFDAPVAGIEGRPRT